MAARFFGRYEHSLDAKGRLILPIALRPCSARARISPSSRTVPGPLAARRVREARWRRWSVLQEQGRAERNLARIWASGSADVEIDRQGRLGIPSYLRDFARLESGVLVIGALNRVELWNPGRVGPRVLPAEARADPETATSPWRRRRRSPRAGA